MGICCVPCNAWITKELFFPAEAVYSHLVGGNCAFQKHPSRWLIEDRINKVAALIMMNAFRWPVLPHSGTDWHTGLKAGMWDWVSSFSVVLRGCSYTRTEEYDGTNWCLGEACVDVLLCAVCWMLLKNRRNLTTRLWKLHVKETFRTSSLFWWTHCYSRLSVQ